MDTALGATGSESSGRVDPRSDSPHEPPSLYVRTLYDFDSPDPAVGLSFRAGEIIKVLTQLESGWWDGLLSPTTRGWFPSNYVERIDEHEAQAEAELAAQSFVPWEQYDDAQSLSGSGGSPGSQQLDPLLYDSAHADALLFHQYGQQVQQEQPAQPLPPGAFHDTFDTILPEGAPGPNDAFEELAEAAMRARGDDHHNRAMDTDSQSDGNTTTPTPHPIPLQHNLLAGQTSTLVRVLFGPSHFRKN